MRRTLICGSPFHRGDRLIRSRLDAFERRIEFRRLADQGRESVVLDRVVCRACVAAEVADRRGLSGSQAGSLFNVREEVR